MKNRIVGFGLATLVAVFIFSRVRLRARDSANGRPNWPWEAQGIFL